MRMQSRCNPVGGASNHGMMKRIIEGSTQLEWCATVSAGGPAPLYHSKRMQQLTCSQLPTPRPAHKARQLDERQPLSQPCNHTHHAGATPAFSKVTLAGPSAREGRLLVQTGGPNGTWGTVCAQLADGNASALAKVVCRQLGFGPDGASARTSAFYGPGKLPFAARVYSCRGSEQRLEDCVASGTVTALGSTDRETRLLGECTPNDGIGVWCAGELAACIPAGTLHSNGRSAEQRAPCTPAGTPHRCGHPAHQQARVQPPPARACLL